jgi:hypothetical protein
VATVATDRICPIGVVGAGHSGTTIVYRMLALHPDVTWLSQYSYPALFGARGWRRTAAAADRWLRRVTVHDWTKTRLARGWRRVVPTPIEAFQIWDALMSPGDPADQTRRIRAALTRACALACRDWLVVKPPGRYRSRCAPMISSAFRLGRYIHVTRDGRAVALSVSQKRLKRSEAEREVLLRRGAEHWLRALRQVGEYERQLPVLTVRYEALCADVWGQLRRMLEFAGLDPDRFPYVRLPRTLTSTNDDRLRRAAPDELAVLDGLLADDLRRYGYVPDLP